MTQEITCTARGEAGILVAEMNGRKQAKTVSGDDLFEMNQLLGNELLEVLQSTHEVTVLPSEDLDGKAMFVVEGVFQEEAFIARGVPAKSRAYISKDDGLVRKVTLFNAEGKKTGETRFDNIKRNVDMEADQFSLDIPEDAEVIERKVETLETDEESTE